LGSDEILADMGSSVWKYFGYHYWEELFAGSLDILSDWHEQGDPDILEYDSSAL
jgi:hypothetical protein